MRRGGEFESPLSWSWMPPWQPREFSSQPCFYFLDCSIRSSVVLNKKLKNVSDVAASVEDYF